MTLSGGATNNYIADNVDLSIVTGTTVNLNFTGTDIVGSLTVDGVAQAAGVYGAGSFTELLGIGTLTVDPRACDICDDVCRSGIALRGAPPPPQDELSSRPNLETASSQRRGVLLYAKMRFNFIPRHKIVTKKSEKRIVLFEAACKSWRRTINPFGEKYETTVYYYCCHSDHRLRLRRKRECSTLLEHQRREQHLDCAKLGNVPGRPLHHGLDE